jgi:hypothetical protein
VDFLATGTFGRFRCTCDGCFFSRRYLSADRKVTVLLGFCFVVRVDFFTNGHTSSNFSAGIVDLFVKGKQLISPVDTIKWSWEQ